MAISRGLKTLYFPIPTRTSAKYLYICTKSINIKMIVPTSDRKPYMNQCWITKIILSYIDFKIISLIIEYS
jgi:hypothetical protein